jgi:hypothetical protein
MSPPSFPFLSLLTLAVLPLSPMHARKRRLGHHLAPPLRASPCLSDEP